MPKNRRDGLTQINLELADRNLLNNMVKASGLPRATFVSRLIRERARQAGMLPGQSDNYGKKRSKPY